MTINTAYLSTPTNDDVGSNATTVFSDISLTGTLYAAASASAGAVTGTTGTFTDAVTVGDGTAIAKVSSATVAVVAMTCAANQSTTTTFTWSGATIANDETDPDTYLVATKSAFSADVVVDAYASDKDTVTLRYSNVSATAAVFAAQTMRVPRIEF